jgi:hypothetical protein
MSEYIHKRLLVLFVALTLIVVSVVLTGQAVADVTAQAGQGKTLDRDLEPVILKGAQVADLIDTPVEHLFVYTFSGNSLSGQVPVQVDEVTASGSYTATGNGLLDADDEIVFMAADLGDQPANMTGLYTLPISATWYEIEVTNPLSPTQKGWAYLVGSDTLTHVSKYYVDYNDSNKRIIANQYSLDFATTHIGFEDLTLNGSGTDMLDRTKLRVTSVLGTLTEVDLGPADEHVLIKDGPVRVILRRRANALGLASLTNTYLAYASMVHSFGDVESSLTISKARMSVDLSSTASGATFYNANTSPDEVLINGNPDVVAETPLSNWAQVSTTTGRLIQVSDPTPAGGTQKNYYCDDSSAGTTECDGTPRTGDDGSYGDAGLLIEGNVNSSFTIESSLFVLPPSQDNVGDKYAGYFNVNNRLKVMAYLQGVRSTIFLPIILKNSQ